MSNNFREETVWGSGQEKGSAEWGSLSAIRKEKRDLFPTIRFRKDGDELKRSRGEGPALFSWNILRPRFN